MKLYKVYTSFGEHDGYFCHESGDIGLENYCPCEDDEIIETDPSVLESQAISGSNVEIDSKYLIPVDKGFEEFLKTNTQ